MLQQMARQQTQINQMQQKLDELQLTKREAINEISALKETLRINQQQTEEKEDQLRRQIAQLSEELRQSRHTAQSPTTE
jgi:methylthioribose-1-phosphate isomerase